MTVARLPTAPDGTVSINHGRKFARPGGVICQTVRKTEAPLAVVDAQKQAIRDWPYRYRPFCRVREDRTSSMGTYTKMPYCVDILIYPWLPAGERHWSFAGRFTTKEEAEMHIASLAQE